MTTHTALNEAKVKIACGHANDNWCTLEPHVEVQLQVLFNLKPFYTMHCSAALNSFSAFGCTTWLSVARVYCYECPWVNFMHIQIMNAKASPLRTQNSSQRREISNICWYLQNSTVQYMHAVLNIKPLVFPGFYTVTTVTNNAVQTASLTQTRVFQSDKKTERRNMSLAGSQFHSNIRS